MTGTLDLRFSVEVKFACPNHANIAKKTLSVDAEPRKNIVTKTLEVSGNLLRVNWTAKEARILRTSVTAFFENIILIVQTIEQFGE